MTPMLRRRGGFDLVTFGEALAVLIAEDGLPLDAAGRFRRTVAGAEVNVAIGMARLGNSVALATRVGRDGLGTAVTRALRGEDLHLSVAEDAVRGTGILIRDVDGGRGRTEVVYGRRGSAGSALALTDLPLDQWRDAAVVHITGITAALSSSSREAVVAAAHALRADGVAVCLDPNIRLRLASRQQFADALRSLRGCVDIAIGSPDELCLFAGTDSVEAAIRSLLDEGCRLIVVKSGPAGSWATDGTNTWKQPALQTAVIDPVGAGDAFVAGVLSALLDTGDAAVALRRGAEIAMSCVAVVGDIEGLPTRSQVDEFALGRDVHR